jgi:uncharacterized protein YegP (UPF0339 family)
MSTSDLKFVIFRDVNDGYWWRLRSAGGETVAISERGFQDKAYCQQEIQYIKSDKYPSAEARDAAIG